MRRFLTLVCLLCVALPAGVSIAGCYRNPDANYCNGLGYGLQITNAQSISLKPTTAGISMAWGQTLQIGAPTATTCKGTPATVGAYTYGTTNNQVVDISPTGNMCAGTWNRNTGGGIANYTVCNIPSPLPLTGGLPYSSAYVTAAAQSVTSNPVEVYVHAQVTSVSLVTLPLTGTSQQCFSQNTQATLDAQACFAGSNNVQQVLCAPPSVTSNFACAGGLPAGVTSVPDCTAAIGTLNYLVGTPSIASIQTNTTSNQVTITAEQPGTTTILASVAGGASSAGYFSTCPPKSISVTLANGDTTGTVTQGVTQNLTTTVIDTNNNPITGLTLDYQSTDPIDISVSSGGSISTNFPSVASITAICQPTDCNPAPINETGLYGTGLSLTSNPVTITTPGTASDFIWFAAPGQSQYFVPVELLTGTLGSNVRLPYVPNSMMMDRLGTNLFFGSSHELMIYSTTSDTLTKGDPNAPGVVLAVAPNDQTLLINDPVRQVFYIYNVTSGVTGTFGGLGSAAAFTPDSKTLYITDSASLGAGHTDTLYVYNVNTGWTTSNLSATGGATNLAITIPGVGAYLSGNPTVAHTWCPAGTVSNTASMAFYPQGDLVSTATDVLAATSDGDHIVGAALNGGSPTLSDIGVKIPDQQCPGAGTNTLTPLTISHTLSVTPLGAVTGATAIDQVVTGSFPQVASAQAAPTSLAFVTYSGSAPGAPLPYYVPAPGGAAGTLNYVTLTGGAAVTAPLFGAFSPDNTEFFVSTAGDNQVHYISIPTSPTGAPKDVQQVSPNLPACTPVSAGGNDLGCAYTGSGTVVPVTSIWVKPRSTT